MREVVLGKSGLAVSAVGFGGIPIMRLSEDEAVRTIRAALDMGVTFIDTAAGYGDSQKKIGRAIAGRRDSLVIATKSGQATREGMLADVERARSEMGIDCIDLFQFHGVSKAEKWQRMAAPGGAVEALLEAREKGWIAHIGVTSHSLDLAIDLVDEPLFETIQFPFNMVTCEPAEALIPKARANGLGFIVMKPLCGGQWDDAELAFKFLNGYPDLAPIPGIERVEEIEQIVRIVESGAVLAGKDRERGERVAGELGKLFCRRCGYCMPCPQGVPIQTAMILDGMVKRLPRESVANGPARNVAEGAPNCTECGECEAKCPYELPIIDTVRKALEQANALVEA